MEQFPAANGQTWKHKGRTLGKLNPSAFSDPPSSMRDFSLPPHWLCPTPASYQSSLIRFCSRKAEDGWRMLPPTLSPVQPFPTDLSEEGLISVHSRPEQHLQGAHRISRFIPLPQSQSGERHVVRVPAPDYMNLVIQTSVWWECGFVPKILFILLTSMFSHCAVIPRCNSTPPPKKEMAKAGKNEK